MPKRLSETVIFERGRFVLKDIEVSLDDATSARFQMWDKPDTAMIVPVLDDRSVLLVREYHAAVDATILSLPKGRVEP